MQCKAKTKDGKQCQRKAVNGEEYCWQHSKNPSQSATNNRDELELTEQQIKAIDLLVTGEYTKTEIAEKCDIYRKKLYRWLDDEKFQAAYKERLNEIKAKFSPQLINKINETMNSINPANIDNESDKVSALEKLFKLYQLLHKEPTDIVKNQTELTGKDGGPIKHQDTTLKELLDKVEGDDKIEIIKAIRKIPGTDKEGTGGDRSTDLGQKIQNNRRQTVSN